MKKIVSVILAAALMSASTAAWAESETEIETGTFSEEELAMLLGDMDTEAAPPLFATIEEAMTKGEFTGYESWDDGLYIAVFEYEDRYIRTVSALNEEELVAYNTISGYEDFEKTLAEREALARGLSIIYTEDLTDAALEEEELEATVGRSVGELKEDGWEVSSYGSGTADDGTEEVQFSLTKGFFEYEFVMNESVGTFEQCAETDNYDELTVKSVNMEGRLSGNSVNLSYLADGTYVEPEAEEESGGFDILGGLDLSSLGLGSLGLGSLDLSSLGLGSLDLSSLDLGSSEDTGSIKDTVFGLLGNVLNAMSDSPEETETQEQ